MAELPRRTLGRTGFEVVALGLGAGSIGEPEGQLTGDQRDRIAVEAIHRAIELGLNYLDTSPLYRDGESERRVGLALAHGWRDRVILATKAGTHRERRGDYSAEAITWTVENSRRVMGTDVIDVLLVHDPADMAPVMAPGGALEALEQLKGRGVIRAIGLGVQNHAHLRLAIESGRFDVVQTPYDFNLIRTTVGPLLTLAASRGVGVVNASPFQQGLLAGPDPDEANRRRVATNGTRVRARDLERARHIYRWAQVQGVDLPAMAVQFCLREARLATTLIGPRSPEEVEEDVAAALRPVAPELWVSLQALLPTLPAPSPGGEISIGTMPPMD